MNKIFSISIIFLIYTTFSCMDLQHIVYDEINSKINPWVKTIGGNKQSSAYTIQQTRGGGYIIAGSSNSTDIIPTHGKNLIGDTGFDIYVLKTDKYGNTEWNALYGGSGTDHAFSLIKTSDGGYILAGYTTSKDLEDSNQNKLNENDSLGMYILKLKSNGEKQWDVIYSGNNRAVAYSIVECHDEGYIVAGYTTSKNLFPDFGQQLVEDDTSGMYLLKINSIGEKQWSGIYDVSSYSRANSIIQTSDEGYAVVGTKLSSNQDSSNSDIYMLKIKKNGEKEWDAQYGDSGHDSGNSIIQTSDGGYIIAGESTKSTNNNKEIDFDFYVLKIKNNGDEDWDAYFGGSGNDYGNSIIQTSDGSYIATGTTTSTDINPIHENEFINNYSQNIYTVKINNDGLKEWDILYGGDGDDFAYSIAKTKNDGFIISGSNCIIRPTRTGMLK